MRGQVGLGDRQTGFDWLVELFGGLVGARLRASQAGGCVEVTDTLYVDCVGTPRHGLGMRSGLGNTPTHF